MAADRKSRTGRPRRIARLKRCRVDDEDSPTCWELRSYIPNRAAFGGGAAKRWCPISAHGPAARMAARAGGHPHQPGELPVSSSIAAITSRCAPAVARRQRAALEKLADANWLSGAGPAQKTILKVAAEIVKQQDASSATAFPSKPLTLRAVARRSPCMNRPSAASPRTNTSSASAALRTEVFLHLGRCRFRVRRRGFAERSRRRSAS